jgi:CheY-like chemotaxis protein
MNQLVRDHVQPIYPTSVIPRIQRDLGANLPPVECAAYRIAQVFIHLIDHALSSAKERVHFATFAHEGHVCIRICDDGPPVPNDQRRRIFEPLFTTGKDKGTVGLGLSLSQSIVEDHGGRIFLDENVTDGTCFVVQLPAAEEPAEENPPPELPATQKPPRRRVLIVDDEIDLLEMLEAALTSRGYYVDTAASGTTALQLIQSRPYDLIVLDILLPGEVGGRELYHIMRGTDPARADRTLFITADTMNYETRSFLDQVRRPFMEKPFLISRFTAYVQQLLEGAPDRPTM